MKIQKWFGKDDKDKRNNNGLFFLPHDKESGIHQWPPEWDRILQEYTVKMRSS